MVFHPRAIARPLRLSRREGERESERATERSGEETEVQKGTVGKEGRKEGKNESTKCGGSKRGQGRKEGGPFYNCKALAARAKRGLLKRKIKAIGTGE